MYEGIDNSFVLTSMFGNGDIFTGAEISNVVWKAVSDRFELIIGTRLKVIHPPSKWGDYDIVYIRVGFYGVEDIRMDFNSKYLEIISYSTYKENGKYIHDIRLSNNRYITCQFGAARIQNINPIELEKI